MTYRNRRLLDQAHSMPCFVDEPHDCNAYLGCVPMHSDSSFFGRGHGHKSHDFAFASGCSNAHAVLTANKNMDRDTKFYAWLRAHVKTMEWLWTNDRIKVAA